MKIAELFGKGKTVFSCEVFPPKKDSPVDTIYQTLILNPTLSALPSEPVAPR